MERCRQTCWPIPPAEDSELARPEAAHAIPDFPDRFPALQQVVYRQHNHTWLSWEEFDDRVEADLFCHFLDACNLALMPRPRPSSGSGHPGPPYKAHSPGRDCRHSPSAAGGPRPWPCTGPISARLPYVLLLHPYFPLERNGVDAHGFLTVANQTDDGDFAQLGQTWAPRSGPTETMTIPSRTAPSTATGCRRCPTTAPSTP